MTALEGLSDPVSRRIRVRVWWRLARHTFLIAWLGAFLPFAGLVAFFLVAGAVR